MNKPARSQEDVSATFIGASSDLAPWARVVIKDDRHGADTTTVMSRVIAGPRSRRRLPRLARNWEQAATTRLIRYHANTLPSLTGQGVSRTRGLQRDESARDTANRHRADLHLRGPRRD
jgi:hypothetical protein